MRLNILIFNCVPLLIASAVIASEDPGLVEEWKSFKALYHKKYKSASEEKKRMETFFENREKILNHNKLFEKGQTTYDQKMNQFGDMPHEEFLVTLVTGDKNSNISQMDENDISSVSHNSNTLSIKIFTFNKSVSLPESVDWVAKGAVTQVQDQLKCGSCWAFSATGAIESQYYFKTGNLIQLSAQNLVDCAFKKYKYRSFGCNGGNMIEAYKYINDNGGLCQSSTYPYKGWRQECFHNSTYINFTIKGVYYIGSYVQEALATIGPLSCVIDARGEGLQFYHSGIYKDDKCSNNEISHAMLTVGYGIETHGINNGTKYWKIKNSWGTNWGDSGYMKMIRGVDNHCGVELFNSCPIL